jgi:hypothetical protein
MNFAVYEFYFKKRFWQPNVIRLVGQHSSDFPKIRIYYFYFIIRRKKTYKIKCQLYCTSLHFPTLKN